MSAAEAAKLGATLTPSGAEAAGNAAGSIPAWVGSKSYRPEQLKLGYADLQALRQKQPEAVQAAIAPKDAGDKPRFVINKANAAQYAAQLSAGHRALLEQVPEFQMRVFPSLRPAFNLPAVDAATRANALAARLEGTDKLSGAKLGVPFPIPQSGAEVIWNHKLKFRGSAVRRYNNEVIVARDGSFQLARIVEDVKLKYGDPKAPSPIEAGLILYYLQEVLSPKRIAGQLLLVHESTDQTEGGRSAWIYNPGLGRTRRAPNVGYDNPKASADGLMFNDQTDMYNGALDRYSWKLLGKREIYIPYNSSRILAPDASYEKLIRKGALNPEFTRYELHRVWVVEASLKPGIRHSFRRRVFYVDEDSWSIAAVDCYDDRDQLWRFQEAHLTTFPFVPATTGSPEVHYDLQSGRYFVTASYAGDDYPDFGASFDDAYFRPQTLAGRKLRK
ncbi:MAG: DUF1329 domain-containing protein [Nevskiaceae bacterium]|nr:MAG: DUF1329 domain-containing protein [Nevskiaceae bacterium]TAM30484.1 MAG: DUF1329 domain-containing protein [Nevskiaceae bacterium]